MVDNTEYIGVMSPLDLLGTSLKREAIFFDKIAIPNVLKDFIFRDSLLSCPIRSIEYLIDSGIIIDPVIDFIGETDYLKKIGQDLYEKRIEEISKKEQALAKELDFPLPNYSARNLKSLIENIPKVLAEIFERARKQFQHSLGITFQKFGASIVRFKSQLDYDRRGIAIDLRNNFSLSAFPAYSDNFSFNDDFVSGKNEIIRLIIDQLPEPDYESVPWERIIDFRNDPETKKLLIYLRHWITDAAKMDITYHDLLSEILYYRAKYEEHIKLHKMKIKQGILETLLMIPAEMLEGIVRLKPTKMVEALFIFKKKKVELLEEEMKAPGRDLAYLIKSKDEFGN